MGATLSHQAPHAQTVAIRSYVDVLRQYQFLEIINTTRFLKSIKAYDPKAKALLVIKVFIKPPQTSFDLKAVIDEVAREASVLLPYSNILAWSSIIETDLAAYLVRQLARTNLYDRLSMAPFLHAGEKLWFVYQLLRILAILHEECGVVHGDLKTENVLVTGGNWLLLTDFLAHTKPRVLPENNPSEYAFYFDLSNRRTCYLAPERFYTGLVPAAALAPAHDLFAFGCVVMEMYQNGEPTFTLSDLYKYKKGEYKLKVQAGPAPVQNMVTRCLALDPALRPPAHELLQSPVFPPYFDGYLYGFLYELNSAGRFELLDPNKSASDLRMEYMWGEYGRLAAALGLSYPSLESGRGFNGEGLNERDSNEQDPNEQDFNERDSNEQDFNGKYFNGKDFNRENFPYYRLALPGMDRYCIKSQPTTNDGCLIVLNTVLSLISTLERPESKIKACELILALSEHISDDAKLDRSVAYLWQFLEDFLVQISHPVDAPEHQQADFMGTCHVSSRVACVALVCVTNLLETCTRVNSINVHIFSEYLNPKLRAVAFMSSRFQQDLDHLKCTMALCFPYLVRISGRFDGFSQAHDQGGGGALSRENGSRQKGPTADFSEITEALLTLANVDVRICLVNHLLPLCQYFGVDKTNDVILPHLITYLNDSSYQLRLAFLLALIGIGNFIGVLAFEQYLIPLLLQTLGDHEVLVVLKALEIFLFFVQEKLIMAEFNALSIYKELLKLSLPLLVQPNEWIRQSVICLVLAVAENLVDADRFCFLYPLIKTYLTYDISVLSWETVYPSLVKPLSPRVFDMALTWLHKSTLKSLFWKQKQVSVIQANGRKRLVSYSKDSDRLVYLGRGPSPPIESAGSDLPLSNEDRSWVLKLKSVGMDIKDLWKVFALKDHLSGISRLKSYSETGHQRNFELASTMNIPPKTVFFEVRFKSEPITENGTEVQQKEPEDAAMSMMLPKKASASLQTSQANAFGEFESHELGLHGRPPNDRAALPGDRAGHQAGGAHSLKAHANPGFTRMFSISNDKIITSTMRHNFGGLNPYILHYLEHMELQPTLDDFAEFGPTAKCPQDFSSTDPARGKLVARFKNNANTNSTEAVTKVAVAPYSEFFVSGSDTGTLRVWDARKVEALSTSSAQLTLTLDGSITDISFMLQRFVFAAATSRGRVGVYRVHVARGKNRRLIKLSRVSAIRDFVLADGYATALKFVVYGNQTLLVALTTQCHVVGFDVITCKQVFDLVNPPVHGVPETFISTADWLLLGTRDGVLCLWDMRFHICLKAWKVKMDHGDHAAIKQLAMVKVSKDKGSDKDNDKNNGNDRNKLVKNTVNTEHMMDSPFGLDERGLGDKDLVFAMVGGSDEPDVTLWTIPEFECRQVMSSSPTPKINKYRLQELEDELDVANILAEFSLELEPAVNHANTCLASTTKKDLAHLVTATADRRVVVWDMHNIQQSELMCGKSTFHRTQVARDLEVCYEKKETHIPCFDDEVTAIGVLERPQQMVVVGDRSGCLSVFL